MPRPTITIDSAQHGQIWDESGAINLPPVHDESSGTVYVPWTNGRAIGYRIERYDQPDEYIYFNPSTTEEEGEPKPNTFVYHGNTGDPNQDHPVHFYVVGVSTPADPINSKGD